MERPKEPIDATSSARPVTPLWVISVLVAILGLAAAVVFLAMPRGKALDASETADSLFESIAAPIPFGLSLDGARELPSKEVVLSFRVPDAAAAPPAGADEGGPRSLTIMEFPVSRAESVLEEQFQKLSFGGDSMGGGRRGGGRRRGRRGGSSRGGGPGRGGDEGSDKPKLQDAGFLDWQGYSANYARLRHTDSGSKKEYDTVRVNLSTGGRCIIGYLRFPFGVDGSKELSEELLAAFLPREG